jgi:hypothetical protein
MDNSASGLITTSQAPMERVSKMIETVLQKPG